MGSCLSCGSSSTFKNVRVVHLNGYVESFEEPISVSQVIGTPPKHFVCTSAQLLSPSASKPLKADTQLQPGLVYFLLPYSILQADVSPLDLASLAKKLTSIAKTSRCGDNIKNLRKACPFSSSHDELGSVWNSPSRSPGRFAVADQQGAMGFGVRSPCRVRPWKPILDTIREKSFNRRSESDILQERE